LQSIRHFELFGNLRQAPKLLDGMIHAPGGSSEFLGRHIASTTVEDAFPQLAIKDEPIGRQWIDRWQLHAAASQ
jgi:hypothetical protein